MVPENDGVSRRSFVKNSLLIASLPLASPLNAFTNIDSDPSGGAVRLHWLDRKAPSVFAGCTWGVPWKKGAVKKEDSFVLQNDTGEDIPVQSWPLAFWPDGSLKWTGHAVRSNSKLSDVVEMKATRKKPQTTRMKVYDEADRIRIDTGLIECEIPKHGEALIRSISREKNAAARNCHLVLMTQNDVEDTGSITRESFKSEITAATVEQTGNIRTVVKLEGTHSNTTGRKWLPFVIRLYFYEGSEAIRLMHTIVYDGDEQKDFIKGMGVRFTVPLKNDLHNRHIRFLGENGGVFAESVRGLTGLRRDPGEAVRAAQVAGKATPPVSTFPDSVSKRLEYIPAFGDYRLFQSSPDSFEIQKRTKREYGWIQSSFGSRASGVGYVGSPDGGVAFGIRNYWQSYPAQLDIRGADTDSGEVTLWLWAPRAEPMDLRFYHDGMGQDTFEKQREGLEITYEDYEPGFGTAKGVARTSEMQLWFLSSTPSNERLNDIASVIQNPPMLTFSAEHWQKAGVFGSQWNTPSKSSPKTEKIQRQLDWYFDYFQKQVEQHHWYGYWNYGDVMHTYDRDRHMWRYDVGGFAWDNSELSTDIWLWMYYLYSGRPDAFRMAEAMTRHTGEVDVHHLGRFSPLGSRHNVQHWGCSAKQLRISTAENRRFYYYLTGDERTGDLMREQLEAARTLREIVPGRKIGQKATSDEGFANISFGTDWGALASAWFTEWERSRSEEYKSKLLMSMQTIAKQPHGFFTGGADMELSTGKFRLADKDQFSVSHLSAAFGLAEICAELIGTINMPEFEKSWIQYCELYNASAEEQTAAIGRALGKMNLAQGHARLTAFAAVRKKSPKLAARAWKEFYEGSGGIKDPSEAIVSLGPPITLNKIDEAEGVSTNAVAQWGLTAMILLGMIGNQLTEE